MDPLHRAQNMLLCGLCKAAHRQSRCERCDINLCKVCVGEHLSDTSIRHKVVHYKYRKSLRYSKCPEHADEQCKHYCEECDISVCLICINSGRHGFHDITDNFGKFSSRAESLQKDLDELETRIYPRYEEMWSEVQTEKVELETKYWKLTTAADQQGEILHREVTAIVNQRKSAIQKMKINHITTLNKSTKEITQKITELKQIIANLKSTLKSNDVSSTYAYKSRNFEFRTLTPKVRVTLPRFSPQKINKDQLDEMFGSLSLLSINTEHGETMKSPEAVSSSPVKSLLGKQRLATTIDTGYSPAIWNVSCLSEEKIWTIGDKTFIKLFNLQGELLTSMPTNSLNWQGDIAVTRSGDLVYSEKDFKTVNLVKNKQVQTVIRLEGWIPLNICSTAYDDILVTMISKDGKQQSKVVRYSGSKATQTIQFDDQGRPLYSFDPKDKYICENRNLDICVADNKANALVVVNRSGKLRFKYTGHPFTTKESFEPVGSTTDSQSHILIADHQNGLVHILDQDGQFIRYIFNVHYPIGLCVDMRDNLFVAELNTAKVKKIQYLYTQC